MPSYVILTSFIQTGIENDEESPERMKDTIESIELMGGELRKFFVMIGRYDSVLITDFQDDKTATRAVLALGKSENITIETLKAFDLDAFQEIVAHVDEGY